MIPRVISYYTTPCGRKKNNFRLLIVVVKRCRLWSPLWFYLGTCYTFSDHFYSMCACSHWDSSIDHSCSLLFVAYHTTPLGILCLVAASGVWLASPVTAHSTIHRHARTVNFKVPGPISPILAATKTCKTWKVKTLQLNSSTELLYVFSWLKLYTTWTCELIISLN